MDRLTLLMSHVYPITLDMLLDLLGIDLDEAETLWEKAKKHVFIKLLPDWPHCLT